MCLVGSSCAARSNAPTWKWVSADTGSPSQVNVDPHLAQNPRHLPGDELNFVISPLITVYAVQSNATKTETGAPLCFRIVRLTLSSKASPKQDVRSHCRDCIPPSVCRLGSEDPERRPRDEMTLK